MSRTFVRGALGVLAIFGLSDATPAGAQGVDATDWGRAQTAGTREAYQAYLAKHPLGAYAPDAFRAIVEQDLAATEGARGLAQAGGDDADFY